MGRKKGLSGITNPVTQKLRTEHHLTLMAWADINQVNYAMLCQVVNGYRHHKDIEHKLRQSGLLHLVPWKNGKEARND